MHTPSLLFVTSNIMSKSLKLSPPSFGVVVRVRIIEFPPKHRRIVFGRRRRMECQAKLLRGCQFCRRICRLVGPRRPCKKLKSCLDNKSQVWRVNFICKFGVWILFYQFQLSVPAPNASTTLPSSKAFLNSPHRMAKGFKFVFEKKVYVRQKINTFALSLHMFKTCSILFSVTSNSFQLLAIANKLSLVTPGKMKSRSRLPSGSSNGGVMSSSLPSLSRFHMHMKFMVPTSVISGPCSCPSLNNQRTWWQPVSSIVCFWIGIVGP